MRMSATEKVPANHSRRASTGSRCPSRYFLRNSSKLFHADVLRASPENINIDQGRLAASTELSAANSHSITSLRPCGSAGISASLRPPYELAETLVEDAHARTGIAGRGHQDGPQTPRHTGA